MVFVPADVKSKLDKFSKLQSMPQVIYKIKQISEDPQSSAADLADCILSDHQLTSRVLKVANSAHYGSFYGKINTVTRAIILIGSQAVRNIAISMGVFQIVNTISKDSKFDIQTFWTRSLGCGIIAKHLIRFMNYPKMMEEAFIAGFMHNIGQAVLASIYPDKYGEVSKIENEAELIDIDKTEKVLLGVDHTQVGEYMARKWNLPTSLIKAISEHHRIKINKATISRAENIPLALVSLGNLLYPYVMSTGWEDSDDYAKLRERIVSILGISSDMIDQLPEICRTQINEIAAEFSIDIGGEIDQGDGSEGDFSELRQQLSNKEVQLAFLQNATESLYDAKSEEEILQIICEAIMRGMQMGRVLLFEYDSKGERFTGRVGFGFGSQNEIKALEFTAKTGLFGKLQISDSAINVAGDNPEIYKNLVSDSERERLELDAFAALPIRVLDKTRFAVVIDAHDRSCAITDDMLRSLSSLINQGAMSIERILLKERLNIPV